MIDEKAQITQTIDWYSYTADAPRYHPKSTMTATELKAGMMGYTGGIKFLDGRLELVNPSRPDMRTHVQYSGLALLSLFADYSISPHEVISIIAPRERVSRIDLAVDVKGGCLDIGVLAARTKAGNFVSPAKKAYYVSTLTERGETLYIGSPKSKMRARIYDKAAEQGVEGLWTRIELQIRGARAQEAKMELREGNSQLDSIPALIKGFIDFPLDRDFALALGNAKRSLSAPENKQTNTRQWLLNVVAPVLARVITEDEAGKFAADFMIELKLQREAYRKYLRTISQ